MASFPDPIQHLLPHGGLATLSGATGVGKTAFLASVIATIQRGEPLWGFPTAIPPAIGVLACDRPWRDHAAWFAKAGCAPFTYLSLRDIDFVWDSLRDWRKVATIFSALIDSMKLPAGALLFVDPISLFIPGRLIDYKDVAIGIGVLSQHLKPKELTTWGVFHVSKQKAGGNDRYLRPQDRILGSTALLGYTETAFYLLSPAEAAKPHYEFGYVCHQLPDATFAYKRNPNNGLFVPAEYLDLVQDQEAALSLLPEDPNIAMAVSIWAEKITKTLGGTVRSAQGVIKQLRAAGRVERAAKGLYRRARPH